MNGEVCRCYFEWRRELLFKLGKGLRKLSTRLRSDTYIKLNNIFFLLTTAAPPFANWEFDVDWEVQGAITTPQDQRWYGSCWAHISVGAIEG